MAASQTLITSTGGGYTSGTISAPGNGSLPGIQANMVVTGPVVSGYSLTEPAERDRDFHPDGQLRLEYGNRQHACDEREQQRRRADHLHRDDPHA